MRIRRKQDLDALVAAELGLSLREVRGITRAFLEQLKEALAACDEVHLPEFGRFRTVIEKGATEAIDLVQVTSEGKKKKRVFVPQKVRVHFSKAEGFKRMMQARLGTKEKTS